MYQVGKPPRSLWFSTVAVALSLAGPGSFSFAAEDPSRGQAAGRPAVPAEEKWADMSRVSQMVAEHLASQPGYERGFLITKSDVAPVFALLKKGGWNAAELDRAFAAVLDDSHFLVTQMRTPQGVKFMREAGKFELNYDRMDRVSQVKGGKQAIANTVSLGDGPSFWNPNAKPGFSNTASMLPTRGGQRRSASEFSRPTGKIYTEEQLVQRLSAIHKSQRKPGGQRKDKSPP